MKRTLVALLLTFVAAACQDSIQYETQWHGEGNPQIAAVISKHQVANCGIYRYKASTNLATEYLVRCSKLGDAWTEYTLSIGTGEISSPRLPTPKYN